jgi:isocitrate dehydrogenase
MKFSEMLESSVIEAVEDGHMTKDLAILATGSWDVKVDKDYLVTEAFMDKIDDKFQ